MREISVCSCSLLTFVNNFRTSANEQVLFSSTVGCLVGRLALG